MKKSIILIFLLSLLLGCANNAEKEKSYDAKENSGFVRNAHSMVYHAQESQIYLFGGANEKEVLSHLWVLDSAVWRKVVTKNEPEPRTFASLVYDMESNRLLLFGGSKVLFGEKPDSLNILNDTWEFKNNQWTKLITKNSPSPRAEAAVTYDESRKKIVLFGGYNIQNGEYIKLGDTWEFFDNDWHLASTIGPSERNGASMAYDPENKYVVLFGGSAIDKQYGEQKGETWKWDGENWNKLNIEQPNGIFNAVMVYDKALRKLVRFGGWNGNSRINETWSFSNNQWEIHDTENSPSARNHSYIVYDEKNKKIVLFGGHDGDHVFGDTWEFANDEWRKISETKTMKRIENGH